MRNPAQQLVRRRFLELGGGLLSLTWGGLLRAQAAQTVAPKPSPVRSCILIFYYGGPSQFETYDPKPNAPQDVRGEFKPISTSVPGVQIGEHLPRMAKLMHKVALVRSVTHQARLHDSASIHALTGRPLEGPDRELFAPLPQVYPSYGSAVSYFRQPQPGGMPYVSLPYAFQNVQVVPAQGAGFLGSAYDPLRIDVDPAKRQYQVELLKRGEGMHPTRFAERSQLLSQLDHPVAAAAALKKLYPQAQRLLDSSEIHYALDITQEPASVRERYGFGPDPVAVGEGGGGGNGAELAYARQMRGQNLLLARRLVEAGAPFVNVYDCKQQGQNWDAHFKCFNQHKTHLLPLADQSLSALIEDLDSRGLLESTLVVAMGEFGRTPKINGDGGRDHWPDCYTVLLAGGGVQGGAVYGASDRIGAYPAVDPVTPGDLAATIFWRFGINPATPVFDQTGRPHRLAAGEPITSLFR